MHPKHPTLTQRYLAQIAMYCARSSVRNPNSLKLNQFYIQLRKGLSGVATRGKTAVSKSIWMGIAGYKRKDSENG